MNEELVQREGTEQALTQKEDMADFGQFEIPADGDVPDLSDDDLAASLGFITTLGEKMLPPPQEEMAEEEMMEEPIEEDKEMEDEETEEEVPAEEPTDEHMAQMERQDKEIRALWEEIGKLKGEKTEE